MVAKSCQKNNNFFKKVIILFFLEIYKFTKKKKILITKSHHIKWTIASTKKVISLSLSITNWGWSHIMLYQYFVSFGESPKLGPTTQVQWDLSIEQYYVTIIFPPKKWKFYIYFHLKKNYSRIQINDNKRIHY